MGLLLFFLSEFYATMPGLDSFVAMEKSQRIRNFLEVNNDLKMISIFKNPKLLKN